MAIQMVRNGVVQQSKPLERVAQQVVQRHPNYVMMEGEITREEFDALKAEVAALRELLARKAVAPAAKSRAEYYREYRKRPKP